MQYTGENEREMTFEEERIVSQIDINRKLVEIIRLLTSNYGIRTETVNKKLNEIVELNKI